MVRLAVGELDDAVDHRLVDLEDAADRPGDQLHRIVAPDRRDLDLLEEVVPGAALLVPLLADLDPRHHRHQVLGEALHEQAAQPLVDPRVVVVELVDLVDQQHQLDLLRASLLEDLEDPAEVAHQVAIAVIRIGVEAVARPQAAQERLELVEDVLGEGGEELRFWRPLEVDVDREELVIGIVELLEPSPELVLERGLADAPLAVEQQAVVVDRLQDAFDQLLPAEEHLGVEHRRAGDVGVETALHELTPPPSAMRPHPGEDGDRQQGHGQLEPE